MSKTDTKQDVKTQDAPAGAAVAAPPTADGKCVLAAETLWSDMIAIESVADALSKPIDDGRPDTTVAFERKALIDSFCIHFAHFYRLFFRETCPSCNVDIWEYLSESDGKALLASAPFQEYRKANAQRAKEAAEHQGVRLNKTRKHDWPFVQLAKQSRALLDLFLKVPQNLIASVSPPDTIVYSCLPPLSDC